MNMCRPRKVASSIEAAFLIDEFPILSVAAASANGKTIMKGLSELRYKESDRLSSIFEGLIRCGVKAETEGDNLVVFGSSGKVKGGGLVKTHFDHRIAMAFTILSLTSFEKYELDNMQCVDISLPNFFNYLSEIAK